MHELWGKIIALVWLVVTTKNQALFGSFVSKIIMCGKLTLAFGRSISVTTSTVPLCSAIILLSLFWSNVTGLERAACVSVNPLWPNPVLPPTWSAVLLVVKNSSCIQRLTLTWSPGGITSTFTFFWVWHTVQFYIHPNTVPTKTDISWIQLPWVFSFHPRKTIIK